MTEIPSLNELLADLADAYPKQRAQVSANTFRIYLEDLGDLPVGVLQSALRDLRRTSDWFPTINQILEQVAEIVLSLPGEAEALAQVEAGLRGQSAGMHTIVRRALDLLGGPYAWRTTDDPGVMRGQFSRIYRELRSEAVRDHQRDRAPAELPLSRERLGAAAARAQLSAAPEEPASPEKLAADAQRFRDLSATIGKRI